MISIFGKESWLYVNVDWYFVVVLKGSVKVGVIIVYWVWIWEVLLGMELYGMMVSILVLGELYFWKFFSF